MSMMPIFTPQPCDNGCCASIFSGFCLSDGTPIAVVINNGLTLGWINISTGAFHVGAIPAGAGPCPIPVEVTTQVEVDVSLSCETDSITVCQGTDPWIVSGTIAITATDLDIRPLDCLIDSIEVCQGTSPWVVSGTVELGATTLAALETITVLQGTSPWAVSGTVELGDTTLAALETITVLQGTSPWVVTGTVELGATTLAALEIITVLQGTNPWIVSANDLDIRNLNCTQDSVTVCQPVVTASIVSTAQNSASVTVLAANANRKSAIIYNNSNSTAWIKFGATASQTSFSVRIVSETFYELTIGYTGVIDAIWQGAGAGSMRVTEFV